MTIFRGYSQVWRLSICIALIIGMIHHAQAQDFNKNASLSFINHTTPKSPESASIEKYGTVPVNENTGIPSISISLYTVKSASLAQPVTLSYHASGIKVSQEATWVGLGWDLISGGRITLDIKGGWDKYTKQFLEHPGTKSTISYLFSGYAGSSPTFSFAANGSNWCGYYYSNNFPTPIPHCGPLKVDSLNNSTYFHDLKKIVDQGIAEPDLFHANFLGHSFTFYRDLITDSIKLKGQENLFLIEEVIHSTLSNSYVITDNQGIKYYFEQEEKSFYLPYLEGLFSSATTAWLLSRVQHPNGDFIQYEYNNYGHLFPAPGISENEKSEANTYSGNTNIYGFGTVSQKIFQQPQYLTRIRTKNTDVDFVLSARLDIAGAGARKVDKVLVRSRINNEIIKQVKFNYDYFNSDYASAGTGNYYFDTSTLHQGVLGPSNNAALQLNVRLKLISIDQYGADSANAESHQFFYDGRRLPNKVSLSQDHWGYYNAKNMSILATGLVRFTPSIASLVEEGILSTPYVSVWTNNISPISANVGQLLPGHADRRADENFAGAAMLDSIVYPTGGSTKFEFELHRSYYQQKFNGELLGGGFRIKKMTNYARFNQPTTVKTYEYKDQNGATSGIYMGNLDYLLIANRTVSNQQTGSSGPMYYDQHEPSFTLFSNGNLAGDGPLVMYAAVKESVNSTEGYVIKRFDVYPPNLGAISPAFPVTTHTYLEPVQAQYAHGALLSEYYYDKNNALKRTKDYYYIQIDKSDKFYSIKTSLRYIQHPTNYHLLDEYPYLHFFAPMHSYYQLLDSTKEISFENGSQLVTNTKIRYNRFYQPEYTISNDSKGEQSIVYSKTPLSFIDVPQGEANLQGNATAISYMRYHHIYDSPIEQVFIKRKSNGDSLVLRAAYNIYDVIGNVKETFLMENTAPVPITQFQRSYYSEGSYNIIKDSRYIKDKAANYFGLNLSYGNTVESGPFIKELVTKGQVSSFIYDTLSNVILATCEGAVYNEIAYTSFESNHPSNWIHTGTSTNDLTSPTGSHCYNLGQAGGSITRTGLGPNKKYILSYWRNSNVALSITGTVPGSIKKGSTLKGWTYFEHIIANQSSLIISGSGFIDELRLYPEHSQMKTFAYVPLFRLTAQTDAAGLINYFTYDASGRLHLVKDQNQKIVKQFDYKIASQKIIFDGVYYYSQAKGQIFTKSNCSSGTPEKLEYEVPEGKYKSTLSQTAADQLALNDLAANGQDYVNTKGQCLFYSAAQTGNFSKSCPTGYTSTPVVYSVPYGKYVSTINQTDANQQAINDLNTNGQALANAQICIVEPKKVKIYCSSKRPSDTFYIELVSTSGSQTIYSFPFVNGGDLIGEVPEGTYHIKIYPESYMGTYDYIIDYVYYQSGVMMGEFNNISITADTYITVY